MPFEILMKVPKSQKKIPYFKWNLNEDQPMPSGRISTLIADGDELEYIRVSFENIPITTTAPKCVWQNDMAEFIFYNLLHLIEHG